MKRRQFLASSIATTSTLGACSHRLFAQESENQLDQYGGWKGKQFEATGFFRLEKDTDRWWMVTPEGNAYLIHGMDHCGLEVISQAYNRDHWNEQLGLAQDATRVQRLKAFYHKKVSKDREYLGFNCLYSHEMPMGMYACPFIPRARSLDIEYWRTWREFSDDNFLDVFSDDFLSRCTRAAKRLERMGRVDDPWVVGYGLTDSPVLTVEMAMPRRSGFFSKPLPGTTTWPVRLRNLGKDAPGKHAFVALMRQRYKNEINSFNNTYNTAFESWDALASAEKWRTRTDPRGNMHEERDNHAFLLEILDKAWGTQVEVIQRHDPNHLIIGDTLNLNEPLSDDIIRVYAKHFPMITYQYYGATLADHVAVMDRFRRVAPDKPMFSADSSWSVKDPPRMPDTLGPQCATYEIAARRMSEVYRAAFARPDFIGWGWCGWMDKWESSEPNMQHAGLQDAFGRWHTPMSEAMSQFGREMFAIARDHD